MLDFGQPVQCGHAIFGWSDTKSRSDEYMRGRGVSQRESRGQRIQQRMPNLSPTVARYPSNREPSPIIEASHARPRSSRPPTRIDDLRITMSYEIRIRIFRHAPFFVWNASVGNIAFNVGCNRSRWLTSRMRRVMHVRRLVVIRNYYKSEEPREEMQKLPRM